MACGAAAARKIQRPDRSSAGSGGRPPGALARGQARGLLLAGGLGRGVLAEPLLEPRDAAAGVQDLLLAGVERVAVRADLDVDRVGRGGAPRGERVPAATGHGGDVVVRVDISLHVGQLLPRAVAGSPGRAGTGTAWLRLP